MLRKSILALAAIAIICPLLSPAAKAQAAADWPMYRGSLSGMGYSSLKQINAGNVANLKQAWSYELSGRGGLEVTPIVVAGVMYVPGLNKVLALDADTGKEIWQYDVTLPSTRGVAYWPGDKDNAPRIVFTTFSRKVIELDAATGKPVPTFGKDGVDRTRRRLQRRSHDL